MARIELVEETSPNQSSIPTDEKTSATSDTKNSDNNNSDDKK